MFVADDGCNEVLSLSYGFQLSSQVPPMAVTLEGRYSKEVLGLDKFTGSLCFGDKLVKVVTDNAAKSKQSVPFLLRALRREYRPAFRQMDFFHSLSTCRYQRRDNRSLKGKLWIRGLGRKSRQTS